jgi:hypothetical protein
MEINLQKLAELEEVYKGNDITLDALTTMVDLVTNQQDINNIPSAPKLLAIKSLTKLGIIIDEAKNVATQLNS